MFNIIKGDIALFGPRPERPEFTKELENSIPYYQYRHIIRPGFTGWAQVKFKYANSMMTSKEKFEYDLYYIKNRNIFMDFGIFLRTVQNGNYFRRIKDKHVMSTKTQRDKDNQEISQIFHHPILPIFIHKYDYTKKNRN